MALIDAPAIRGNEEVAAAVLLAIALGEEHHDYNAHEIDQLVFAAGARMYEWAATRELVEQGLRKLGYTAEEPWRYYGLVYSKFWEKKIA